MSNSQFVVCRCYAAAILGMSRETVRTTDNKEISKMLGQKWKGLTPPQKSKYVLPFKSRKAAL